MTDERSEFLSTAPARTAARRLAAAVVGTSAVVFLAVVPFATVPLTPVWGFIPVYESALAINDLVTAVLLFGQWSFLRSRALVVLASGYLFTAGAAVAHALTFPGLFAPTGLLGAGAQSTAWLYMFWHAGFPLFVIAYVRLGAVPQPARRTRMRPAAEVAFAVAAVMALLAALTLIATAGQDALPAIMAGNHYSTAMLGVVSTVWVSSLAALVLLWRRRPHTVLDLWLMVVMCAWLFDIALSAILNAGRFDVGFYAGRIYGLLAASFVLMVLLIENSKMYAGLVAAHAAERRAHQRATETSAELLVANNELDAFAYSISHDLRAPLRAIDGYAEMCIEDYGATLPPEGRRYLAVIRANGTRMRALLDDLLELSRASRRSLAKVDLDMNALVREVIDESLAQRKGASPRIDVGSLPPAPGDRVLLRQVWENLISNALKYSSRCTQPAIEVSGHRDHAETVYCVRDNGVGFSMEHADKLFGVFQRLHHEDQFSGTGVGLAIVQRLVSRHGGRVWAEGKVNEGAVFSFALPHGDAT